MKIKDKIHEIERNRVKKELTNYLGKVEETSDKLICYVKKSKLNSLDYRKTFFCYGINPSNVKLANAYNLNKPIWYVFNKIKRPSKEFHIVGCYESKIIINNSNFSSLFLDIKTDGKLEINHSTIGGNSHFSLLAKDLELNKVLILHMYKENTYSVSGKNSIKVKDSIVGDYMVPLKFETPNLTLVNNNIVGKNIDIRKVRNLICDDDTTITAKERVNIEANAINQICVVAPSINVNGCEYKTQFVRKEYKEEIDQKRCELLDLLAKIRDKYTDKYSTMLKKHQDSLYSEPLGRSLKK